MWPNAARFAPLVDDTTEANVVVCDIHDGPQRQTECIEDLAAELVDDVGLILTFWPIRDEHFLSETIADAGAVGPPPRLEPTLPRRRERWTVDGGMALSTGSGRRALRDAYGSTFARHLDLCSRRYNWDPQQQNGTDEALLQLYFLSFAPGDEHLGPAQLEAAEALLRRIARPFVHTLYRRGPGRDPPRVATAATGSAAPVYSYRADPERKGFAYDEEAELSVRQSRLVWKAPRAPPRSARVRARQG